MPVSIVSVFKCLAAVGAGKRPRLGVRAHVVRQVTHLTEAFSADLTFVRSIDGVHRPFVVHQSIFYEKLLSTKVAQPRVFAASLFQTFNK